MSLIIGQSTWWKTNHSLVLWLRLRWDLLFWSFNRFASVRLRRNGIGVRWVKDGNWTRALLRSIDLRGSKPTWKTFDRGPSIKLLEASTGLGFDGGWEMKIERWVLRFQGNGFDGMSLNNLKEWVRWEWFWWIFVLMLWWAEMVCWKWKVRMAGSIGSNGLLVWSMNCMLESSD